MVKSLLQLGCTFVYDTFDFSPFFFCMAFWKQDAFSLYIDTL